MSMLKPYRFMLVLLLAAPVLAACGSSSPGSGSGATKYSQALGFANCMRSHGVPNFPDPKSGANGHIQIQDSQRAGSGPSLKINGVPVNAPAFQSAQQACHSLLPNGGKPPQLSASQRQAMLQFSQCMRAHGLTNFPDPQFGSHGVEIRIPSGAGPDSPAFKSAQAACAQYQRQAFALAKGP